jgi:transposase
VIPLTVPEVRRLLLLVAAPEGAERDHHLRWSAWRRQHQAVARRGHRARRAQRPPPAPPDPTPPGPIPVHVVPGTAELSETSWSQIAALLQPAVPQRGRPSGDLRRQLEGMLAVMHSGGPWREVPSACGPWQTIYARYALWVRTGLWERIAAILYPDRSQTDLAAPS